MDPRSSAMTFREAARMIPPSAEHPQNSTSPHLLVHTEACKHCDTRRWADTFSSTSLSDLSGLRSGYGRLVAIPVSRIGCLILPCLSQPRQLNRFRLHEPCLRANSYEHNG